MWRCKFQVEGGFEFPVDMLRYDGCQPETEQDAGVITRTFRPGPPSREKVRVSLVRYGADKANCQPTTARWESFMWKVIPGWEVRKI